jgi:hypothetical protein
VIRFRSQRSWVAALFLSLVFAAGCSAFDPDQWTPPTVDCGDLETAECEAAVAAAAREVRDVGRITLIELGRGRICPLGPFTTTTCPAGALPPADGGEWLGFAVVTFAGTTEQAYLNVAKDGMQVRGVMVALATPEPEPR